MIGKSRQITFERIESKLSIRVSCRLCGNRLTRVVTEGATVNPFNKNPDGSIKTKSQVAEDVRNKIEASAALQRYEGVVCRSCSKEPL